MAKIEKETPVWHGTRFDIVEQLIDFKGKKYKQEMIVAGSGIALVILDNKQNIYMVKEWRAAINGFITQIPGGFAGTDEEQKLLEIGHLEALEELGITNTNSLRLVRTFIPNGGIRNKQHILFMENAEVTSPQSLELTEEIEIVKIPLKEAYDRFVLGNEQTTSATIIGLTIATNLLQNRE